MEGASGMDAMVNALKSIIDLDTFMTAFTKLLPVIGVVLIFSFIYGIVKKVIKGASKGKTRL